MRDRFTGDTTLSSISQLRSMRLLSNRFSSPIADRLLTLGNSRIGLSIKQSNQVDTELSQKSGIPKTT